MSVLEALHTRNSHPRLTAPGPDKNALEQILKAGLRAPDHGRLRPWHFLVIEGERREALGDIFAHALQLANAAATEADLKKARNAPLRAPLIIAGMLKPEAHPKIPRVEQAAAVASALYGMLLAAEALGFAGIWRTGSFARDPHVIASLGGGGGDEVMGFLYLGTPEGAYKPLAAEDIADFVSYF